MQVQSPYVRPFVWAFLLLLSLLWSCADPGATEQAASPKASQQVPRDQDASEEEKPAARPVATAQEHTRNLVSAFQGNYAQIENALKTVALPSLVLDDIEGYDLANPRLLDCAHDCCTVEFESGITKRVYRFCWQDGKLAQVIWQKR
ncbi:MAG: hypothetical protein KF690_01995 [Bacteroidetes bacterium]|nr:hypothetical protein [Bacteroidota bacterium]